MYAKDHDANSVYSHSNPLRRLQKLLYRETSPQKLMRLPSSMSQASFPGPRPADFNHCSSNAFFARLITVLICCSPISTATSNFDDSTDRSSLTTSACRTPGFTPNLVANKEDADLKVLVPNITTLRQFVDCSDPSGVRGFCIDVFEAALSLVTPSALLSPNVSIHYTCFNFSSRPGGGILDYDDMVDRVAAGDFDVVVGDVTIGSNRASSIDFTQKYMESGIVIVTKVVQDQASPWLLFASPFSWRLWCSIVGTFFTIGLLLCYMERQEHPEFMEGSISHRLGSILWFMMGTLILFERKDLKNGASRLLVMSWIFFAVLVGSSYTASLSAILTANNLSSSNVDILSLKDTGRKIGIRRGSIVKGFIEERFSVPSTQLLEMRTNADFMNNLTRGDVIAIVDEIPYATILLSLLSSSTCDFGILTPSLTDQGFGFGFNKNRGIARTFSVALMNLTENGCLQNIQENYGLDGSIPCSQDNSSISKVGLKNSLSVFLPMLGFLILCISAHYIKVYIREKPVITPIRLINDDAAVYIKASFNMRKRYSQRYEKYISKRVYA